jgi:hypothetical protein
MLESQYKTIAADITDAEGDKVCVGKDLDPSKMYTLNICTPGTDPNQRWVYNKGPIQFKRDTTKCIDLPGGSTTNGNQLELWDCNSTPNQNWYYDASSSTLKFTANQSKCVDLEGGIAEPGAKVWLWDCNNLPNQQWVLDQETGRIMWKKNQTNCLDLTGGSTTNGNKLQLWPCNSLSSSITFSLVKTSPDMPQPPNPFTYSVSFTLSQVVTQGATATVSTYCGQPGQPESLIKTESYDLCQGERVSCVNERISPLLNPSLHLQARTFARRIWS